MRSFIAIEFPEEVTSELIKIQKEIDRLGLLKGKFTEQENFHLTLKFLGDLSRSELDAVKEKISEIKFNPFKMEFDQIGVFSEDFIRIIWISLKGDELFKLQKEIDSALEPFFPKEYRFMAHITLARPKFVEDKKTLISELDKINFDKKPFEVDKIVLKKSELTSEGPKYSDLLEKEAISVIKSKI